MAKINLNPKAIGPAAPMPTSTALVTPNTHPLVRRQYRVATTAIEQLVDLVEQCVKYLIPGALIYSRPRMGKTHALQYVGLHLGRHRPDLFVIRLSCEHHRCDYEGPFFSTLLNAVGIKHPQPASIADKRFVLLARISEQVQARKGHVAILLCDEAQRLSKHALEWLRDVHDQLAQHDIRLLTFLVGQPQLLEQRAQFQMSGDEQIVARFMIELQHFRGITNAQDAATCLASYDLSCYPEDTGETFTRYFYPKACGLGFSLERSATTLWNIFVDAHAQAQLSGPVEIPMDYFTRAVECFLLQGPEWDCVGFEVQDAHWLKAVNASGYVAAQQVVNIGQML